MRGPDQPPKPTGDPDPRSRPATQTDPDLTIQTYDPDPFVLSWLDIFFYKVLKSITLHYKVLKGTTLYYKLQYYSVLQTPVLLCTTKYYSVLQSTTLYYKVLLCTTKYFSVLQSTTKYDPGWSREFKKCHPVPDLVPDRFQTRFQTSSMESTGSVPFTAMLPKKKKQVCASSAESFDSF